MFYRRLISDIEYRFASVIVSYVGRLTVDDDHIDSTLSEVEL
jgi:hypothetical protein